jgi:hypothetical protein
MGVARRLACQQLVRFLPAGGPERKRRQSQALAEAHSKPPAQVGEVERGGPVSAICGAEQGEQSLVLRDRQGLPRAHRPAHRREIEPEGFDHRQVWIRHLADRSSIGRRLSFATGKCPARRCRNSARGRARYCCAAGRPRQRRSVMPAPMSSPFPRRCKAPGLSRRLGRRFALRPRSSRPAYSHWRCWPSQTAHASAPDRRPN